MLAITDWAALGPQEQQQLLTRPAQKEGAGIRDTVSKILAAVRSEGDQALGRYARELDSYEGSRWVATKDALTRIQPQLRAAMEQAAANISRFHEAQRPPAVTVETQPGILCEQRWQALERIGIYVPGGSAPLPSSVLMQAIPARIAGVEDIILATPGPVPDVILAAAALAGIPQVLALGGAQAIGAMAYGDKPVVKIFGPGNAYVTEAKRQVALDGIAIDMPAGPSEVMVLADANANPRFVAADLLSQAEHGPDSQVLLVTTSQTLAEAVNQALAELSATLSRQAITLKALANSRTLVVKTEAELVAIANGYAPEHLILQLDNAQPLLGRLKNAGSIFVGAYSPESAGDYASGTNHVLPTYGLAKSYSSLGLLDFMRRFTVQTLSRQGLADLAPTLIALADAEGLDAHRLAVTVRLEDKA
ncbi:histidinol dehydrogenase [Gallaecimonas xiamenensis]|uniref:Histidinol dehydrogenase n=1 Tax=Gallaecimonas xiamenensis 3-C-1 TaxID=745411 RepID=K2JES7_9GAMM|nr:histidinol dehydrogenase [Gallaecimonas xiamenensis]EKE69109.1 bifunctional histidinal dehydrogenase/ histidinol dehydrogenase [Gallaecimonas xiamenensis 3-C-1]